MRIKILLLLILVLAFILRFYQLGQNPPSLSWDEASLGYNAYTILTTGRDEHGEYLPLARFIAFGDFKPPGYIYAAVPSIGLFGVNEFAVRLPSAVAGLVMVLFTYLLVYELFRNKTISLLSCLFIAISPWSLQFSRAAFEANLAACFNLIGVYLFIASLKKKYLLLPSVIFFILSFYTFNSNRIIAPLLLLALAFYYYKDMKKNLKWIFVSLVIGIILILPSIPYLKDRESKVRFQEVSIFSNLTTVETSNQRIATDNNSWWAKVIHNRRILFAQDFLKHYFDNFTGRFLFITGDVNPRLSIQEIGELYLWDLPFLLIGLYLLIIKKEKGFWPVLIWMIIAPIPAATAKETPHALRILSILPTYQIIIAYGLFQLINRLKLKYIPENIIILFFAICALLSFNFYYYLHNYYIHYPVNWSGEWQYGYKQLVYFIGENENKYDQIFITDALGRPYIYFAFYQTYPLENFLRLRIASRDWFGFWNVSSLANINFTLNNIDQVKGRILLANTQNSFPPDFKLLKKINNPRGDVVFYLAEKL